MKKVTFSTIKFYLIGCFLFIIHVNNYAQENGASKGVGASFSPDGQKIAYYKYIEEGSNAARIYTVNVDGTALKEISGNYPNGMHTEPQWSRDGKKIGFSCFGEKGAKIMQVDLKTLEIKELVSVTEDGYHMFSSWDLEGLGYYFFHWPINSYAPNAYYFNGQEIIQLTDDGISTRPQLSLDGGLFISKTIDEQAGEYVYYQYDLKSKQSRRVKNIDGFKLSGNYFIKAEELENGTKFILEDTKGKDLKELATIPFKGVMFETVDANLKYLTFNTNFKDGSLLYIIDLATGEHKKLNPRS